MRAFFPSKYLEILFFIAILLNGAVWLSVRSYKTRWLNVPPAPSARSARIMGIGDPQFAYRIYGIMIQNLGDTGGRTTALADYNMEELGRWFTLAHGLDPQSDFMPFLAAYVFGGVQDSSKVGPLIEYLEMAAGDGAGEKWRWLAQAAYLARFKMHDFDMALRLATKLSQFKNPDLPYWARRMPLFIMNAKGDKQAAYDLVLSILKSSADKLPPMEVQEMLRFMCTRLLSSAEAQKNELCISAL